MRIGDPGIGERELVTIGKVVRVHGLRGDVRVRSLSDVPGRFETLTQVTVEGPGGARRPLAVRGARPIGNDYLVSFEGIDRPALHGTPQLKNAAQHLHQTVEKNRALILGQTSDKQ